MDPFKRIAKLEAQLQAAQEEIQQLRQDCVSGLLGRREFENHLLGAFSNQRRSRDSLVGIIMCDIDHFKQVNDTYGHLVGDRVLRQVALAIQASTRAGDLVARYGGEEFVCLLPGTDQATLALVAERIRRCVEQVNVKELPRVTISVGFALQDEKNFRETGRVQTGWDVVQRADRALYRAKNQGRNRTEGDALGSEEVKLLTEIERRRR